MADLWWGTKDGKPPPAVPVCGFFNELCPKDNTGRPITQLGSSIYGGFNLYLMAHALIKVSQSSGLKGLKIAAGDTGHALDVFDY